MSISVAADLSRHLPSVPTLVWRNHEDLGRLAAWVGENGLGQVALHPGALRAPDEWAWWVSGVAQLHDALSPAIPRLLVTGPCTTERIGAVLDTWPGEITFVTQHPWELAIHGKALLPDLDDERAARDEPVDELFQANCRTFELAIASQHARRRARVRDREHPEARDDRATGRAAS
jgi:hypothetical protein